ncbi:unnamed protein product [Rhodiola kirilowii]
MAAALGWYGPLIDLSHASSHISQFVQLLVFVHRCTPLQFRQSEVIRTDVQVGDDTRPFFSVTLWGKNMASLIAAGDIILLQNVIIAKYGSSVEAKTVQQSSVMRVVHSSESIILRGVDDIVKDSRVGITAKEKLSRVIEWVQKIKPAVCSVSGIHNNKENRPHAVNWKEQEETEVRRCSSLFEVKRIDSSCKASFFASVGEIFLPFAANLDAIDTERMFLSRRIYETSDHHLADDLICTGCQLCGSPLGLDPGSILKKTDIPLYCPRSHDKLHVISSIYKPFMLYVWDEMECIPILVKNMAATLLFGNIRAEKVYSSYKSQSSKASCSVKGLEGTGCKISSTADGNTQSFRKPNIFSIWLILLKVLLKQGKNSPLKFEVDVNNDLDIENGRFEMISVIFPCSNLV